MKEKSAVLTDEALLLGTRKGLREHTSMKGYNPFRIKTVSESTIFLSAIFIILQAIHYDIRNLCLKSAISSALNSGMLLKIVIYEGCDPSVY
jgi:hypothetical protein